MKLEFRETGLPLNEDVFKAFTVWTANAKDFAAKSGMNEDYPVKVAQLVNAASPESTQLMALALLMSVPEPAWGIVEKRFGKGMVEKLDEAWKHVRTGYAYVDEASDEVKGLALAAATVAFDKYIQGADKTRETIISKVQMGQAPQQIMRSLLAPECRAYEKLGEKIRNSAYPDLEAGFAGKLGDYFEARKEQNSQLASMNFMIMDGEEEDADPAKIKAGYAPFESTGLLDDPKVRAAYAVLTTHNRVQPQNFQDALTVGALLSESKDAVTVAAGLIDAGIRQFFPDDFGFLAKKLDPAVIDIVKNYDVTRAFIEAPQIIAHSPRPVQQIALARGIVMMDNAKKQSEELLEMISVNASRLPPEMGAQLRQQGLQPAQLVSEMVPIALAPVFGQTGAPKLESLFASRMQDLDAFINAQSAPAPAANDEDGPVVLAGPGKKPGGRRFRM